MRFALSLLLVAISTALSTLLLVLYLNRAEPQSPRLPSDLAKAIDFDALFESIGQAEIARLHQRIVSPGSRLSGTAGEREISLWVEAEFRRLGLEVVLQRFPVTVPITRWCEISLEDGTEVSNVHITPFWPNLVRTCTTPPPGIVGTVIDVGSGVMEDLEGLDVSGNIALVTMRGGFGWLDTAKLGAAAILFQSSPDPKAYRDKFLGFPASLPRFFVTGSANCLVGKRIRLRGRVDWVEQPARNVFGVLRAANSIETDEALTLIARTDSWSVVPEHNPGSHDAAGLAALIGIARSLSGQREGINRTTVFAALSGRYQGSEGMRRMTDALGGKDFQGNLKLIASRRAKAKKLRDDLVASTQAMTNWPRGEDESATTFWKHQTPPVRTAVSTAARRIIERYIRDCQDQAEKAKVAWVLAGRPIKGPLYKAQLALWQRLRRARTASGANLSELRQHFKGVWDSARVAEQLELTLSESLAHVKGQWQYQDDTIQVANLLGGVKPRIKHHYYFYLEPSVAGEHSGEQLIYRGDQSLCAQLDRTRDSVIAAWLEWKEQTNVPSLYTNFLVNGHRIRQFVHERPWPGPRPGGLLEINPVWPLRFVGKAVFTFKSRILPLRHQTPLDLRVDVANLTAQTQHLAALAAQIASGAEAMDRPGKADTLLNWFSDYGGEVLTLGASNSLLPNQRVNDALVVAKSAWGGSIQIQRSRDGTFRFPAIATEDVLGEAYTIDDATGQITGARDLGPDGQRFPTRLYSKRGASLFADPESRVTILLARFTATDVYRALGPEGQPLTFEVIDARFGQPPDQYSLSEFWEQGATVFVPPGERFYLLMKDLPLHQGAPIRIFGQTGLFTQGFCLGHRSLNPQSLNEATLSSWPAGYLAGRDARMVFQEADAAMSLVTTNKQRLANQFQSGFADPVNSQLADRAEHLLDQGIDALQEQHYNRAYAMFTGALAVSLRAYPSIRTAVYDAVSGIMLYLFLLVPFSFFAEKLTFGFSDIRSRIAGMFGIFLAAFAVIRFTHPAYDLMSSSLVVLVGFIILILCLMIFGFVVGKFIERMRSLQAGGGTADSDHDVSRISASGAAFNLGISNMRKRKVRTSYTVATLVLISFCLVCFTAPRPYLRDRQIAVGPADFNGLVLRQTGDLTAARQRFDSHGDVIARRVTRQNEDQPFEVIHAPPGKPQRQSSLLSLLHLQSAERRASGLEATLLPGSRWFDPGESGFCYLSDLTADQLGIDPSSVATKPVQVTVAGQNLTVRGVFDSSALQTLRDVDGESFLPIISLLTPNERRKQELGLAAGRPGAQMTAVQYVPASKVALLPLDPDLGGEFTSAVVLFDDQSYGSIRQTIDHVLDRSPTFVRYAIDGLAFLGARLRSVGLVGYVDILVPLLVASCIVFNTMLGNVHERTKEISIYSAVGLSPRHVFYLFLAESLVYAIAGVVGGYLLALGLQWLNGVTGGGIGLTIDYSSRSAIYVSLTLMLAVIGSSFVPAYQAARVASPSEHVTWSLPAPYAPGQLRFDLPFTFAGSDILASVPFLTSWFDAHGEDSSGEFSAAPPRVTVEWPKATPPNPYPAFAVDSTVWLRPYDLGVSQEIRVCMRPSDDPAIYMVSIDINRLTGSESAWQRTNDRFVRLLRRHLLSWRGLPLQGRLHLGELAKQMLTAGPKS